MDTIIKLSNINKSYTNGKIQYQVLTDFSWEFGNHCFSILAGPSGSGKSSLLNILATLDEPDSGVYLLNGQPVDFGRKGDLTELRKQNFGFVFQSFNLIPVLSALENVELPLTLFNYSEKERGDMAERALKLVGLAQKMNKRPYEMSGGEQQRVAIARAIARCPHIIFADEPTANLDRQNAINIINLMQELNDKEGLSFIIASHDDKVIRAGKEVIKLGD